MSWRSESELFREELQLKSDALRDVIHKAVPAMLEAGLTPDEVRAHFFLKMADSDNPALTNSLIGTFVEEALAGRFDDPAPRLTLHYPWES